MKTHYLQTCFTLIILSSFLLNLKAQENNINTKDRYIIINELQSFFTTTENNNIRVSFQLCNIKSDESSKPMHISVNELANVVKFSIESHSTQYENQRRCTLVMNSNNYKNTFAIVLHSLDVKHVLLNSQLISLEQFNQLLK